MTIQEIRNQVDKVLGNSLKCLLPSYWFKRLFGITLDKVEEVNRTSVTALTRVNKLSTVAFSGSYNDLTNKPTIPTIPSTLPNPNSLVIKKNGVQKVSYTGSYSATADITGDWYGTSSTSASTAAKSVSCSNYTLTSGERIAVKFTYANTASNPTLNVNNKGAKSIYWNGSVLPSSQYWSAGAVIEFLYDGSYYHMLGAVNDTDTTITVDTAMSVSSTNPVQNKVVKTYVDSAIAGISIPPAVTIDSAMSASSTNPVQNKVITDNLANKVDKVTGKGLSTNDYTTTEKNKLAGIAEGAEVNVQSDWNATSGDAYIKNKPSLATVATSGSYNDLSNKPIIPIETIVDTSMSSTSTNPVQNKVVKEYIDNAVVTPVESVTSTSKNVEPNKYYKWTSAMSSLTITLAAPANESILNNYMFEFTTSSSGCAFSVPSTVKWANGEIPNIEASKTYQVSIINNLAVISNFI